MEGSGLDRRGFFLEFLRRYVAPAADYVGERLESAIPRKRRLLRPPGALPEAAFLEVCHRCGLCAEACPADAIFSLRSSGSAREGTPVVDAERQPCVVCSDLACMQVCPSGALQRLPREEIRMGLARVDPEVCVRSRGEDCRLCVDACPMESRAIRLNAQGEVQVLLDGCVGCGVCQYACPTSPRAIVVEHL